MCAFSIISCATRRGFFFNELCQKHCNICRKIAMLFVLRFLENQRKRVFIRQRFHRIAYYFRQISLHAVLFRFFCFPFSCSRHGRLFPRRRCTLRSFRHCKIIQNVRSFCIAPKTIKIIKTILILYGTHVQQHRHNPKSPTSDHDILRDGRAKPLDLPSRRGLHQQWHALVYQNLRNK